MITIGVLALCFVPVGEKGEGGLLLPKYVAVAAIGKDLILAIGFGVIYISTGKVFVQPRVLGKLCTAMQMLAVLGVLMRPDLPVWISGLPRLLWMGAAGLSVAAACDYVWVGTRHLSAAVSQKDAGGG